MQLHTLKRKTKNAKPVAVGRGGKRGKTSGRGTKGQKARAGRKLRPELRDVIKKLPKLRGRGKNSFKSFAIRAAGVNLAQLSVFKAGDIVSPKTLCDKGVLATFKGKYPRVKILSVGEISTKLNVVDCEVSAIAKEKIEKAGGSVK